VSVTTLGRPWASPSDTKEVVAMSAVDKAKNEAEKAVGVVKEKAGQVTGDDSQRAEGKVDQTKADLKQAGEKVKDAFR
jgi:uncharacterized protein YjbJ (UPF0337 family)